jgi:hypothetical protein
MSNEEDKEDKEDKEYSYFEELENELNMYYDNDHKDGGYYVNLEALLRLIDCEVPYDMCSNNMIQKYIDNNNFVNCKKSFHKGKKDKTETHARIIASLVNLYRHNVNIDKIHVFFNKQYDDDLDDYKTCVEVEDGYHRLRAFKFLNIEYIPIIYET